MNKTDSISTEQEVLTLVRAVIERLDRMEQRFSASIVKESYTVEEAALRLNRAKWTVRQWCNQGQAQANKVHGRGRKGEWRIPHDELLRLQTEGPQLPGSFENRKPSRIAS